MYTELETIMMQAVEKTLDRRARVRKENAIFYGILCGVVFFTIMACGYAVR